MAKNLEVDAARLEMAEIPSLSDDDLYKLFWKWANLNHDMDKGDYFLGSCTMKENDRENERAGSLPGFMNIHPLQPAKTIQPLLKLLSKFKVYLCEITGMFAATLAPLAGAHGELVALKMFRAYHRHVHKGQPRDLMITPATSHGTNPASITMAGMKALPVKVDEDGNVDIDDLERILNDPNNAGRIAGIMLTIPNTLGLFEPRTPEISAMIHAAGALVYMDGANFNAIIGQVRPVDLGVDAMHFNPHKTFGTLHGGGGPGAGPVVVSDLLVEYLPSPTIEHRAAQTTGGELAIAAGYHINHSGPGRSIGNVSGHHGAIGVLIGAARYAFTMGVKGLLEISINATVNANHAFAKIINSGLFKVEHNTEDYRMHECVVTPCDELLERGITTMDIAKRLLDKGVHPPTVYFPKNVHEAIMIEPTDTASKRDVEIFEKAIIEVAREALGDRKALRKAVKELVAAGYREELETQLEAANLLSEAHREQDETVEEALVHTVAESKKMTLEEALDSDQGRRNLGILILAGAPWSRPVRRIDDETSEDTGTSDIEGFLRAELSDEKAQTVKKVEAPPKLRNRNPDDYYFSRSHEYLRVEQAGDKTIATIGITLNAAVLLAKPIDKLPGLSDLAVGQTVAKDGVFDSLIETAKSVADLHCPVSGKIIAVHHDIEKPIIASSDPYGDRTETLEQGGWLMKIELSDPSELDDLMRLPEYLTHARKACGVKYASKFVENEGFDLPASGGGGRTATVAGMQGDLQKAMLSLAKKAKYFDTVAEDTRFVSSVEILKERGKSLLMHAEPALKNGLLLDLQYTLSHIDHNALSEIVIYAEDAGNARAITSLIDAINEKTKKEFKTVIVLKSELLAASKPVGDHVLLLRSLVEYLCAKQESSIRTKEDIFGILIGRMNDNIHEDTLAAATACYASMEKIQVVALTDMGEDAVYGYSFNDALNLLATAADEEYLLFLKPIRRLTPELQREYEEYLRSFEALASV